MALPASAVGCGGVLPTRDVCALQEILRAAAATERHLTGKDERRFLEDELLQSAVAQQFFTLSRAVLHLSSATRWAAPSIPWRELIQAGERMIEPGASIDWNLVWRTATRDLPKLRRRAEELLARSPSA